MIFLCRNGVPCVCMCFAVFEEIIHKTKCVNWIFLHLIFFQVCLIIHKQLLVEPNLKIHSLLLKPANLSNMVQKTSLR